MKYNGLFKLLIRNASRYHEIMCKELIYLFNWRIKYNDLSLKSGFH